MNIGGPAVQVSGLMRDLIKMYLNKNFLLATALVMKQIILS